MSISPAFRQHLKDKYSYTDKQIDDAIVAVLNHGKKEPLGLATLEVAVRDKLEGKSLHYLE
jgi:hypothetical protein